MFRSDPLLKQGCRGRSLLPEREVSSLPFSFPGGSQARQKQYEWMSEDKDNEYEYTAAACYSPRNPGTLP